MGLIVHYIHNNPNTDEMKEFNSISMLNRSNKLISMDFYNLFFDGVDGYFESFKEYLRGNKEGNIED